MITEDYVSFETAKLLKEKGFQAKCTACYRSDLNYKFELVSGRINYCNPRFKKCKMIPPYNAPTIQMAMKWLRKEHHINIIVDCYTDHAEARIMTIEDLPACKCRGIIGEKYEEACEAAIKYCLENLI